MQDSREDDEWCDISDEDIPKVKSDENGGPQKVDSASVEKGRQLESSIPTLFSTVLPPCGLIPQLAYENVVRRLRKLWIERATESSAISIADLCRVVLTNIKSEEDKPVSKPLNPWRRPSVFTYEIRWARYFVREAETAEKRPGMTEKQADKQDFMDRMFPIPKELKILVANRKNQKWVVDLWKEWHHGKRGTVETEDPGLGVGGVREDDGQVEGDGDSKEDEKEKEKVESGNDMKEDRGGISEQDKVRIMQEAEKRLQAGD